MHYLKNVNEKNYLIKNSLFIFKKFPKALISIFQLKNAYIKVRDQFETLIS
jgi:hypothetical protein